MSLILSEFDCPCCGKNHMEPRVFNRFCLAREISGVFYIINSGWRCPEHNKKVGGSETSSHLTGEAGDIKSITSNHRFQVIRGLREAGFTRIGIAKTFIHADDDRNKTQGVIWLY